MHQPRSQLQCPSHRHNSCSSSQYPERSLPVIKGTIGLLLGKVYLSNQIENTSLLYYVQDECNHFI